MASQAGWGRLAEDLRAAGFDVKVSTNPRGQVLHAGPDTYSIHYQVRGEGGKLLGHVSVSDKHGRGGKWYGWSVTAEGTDDLIIGRPTFAVTKRSEIVTNFQVAVGKVQEKAGGPRAALGLGPGQVPEAVAVDTSWSYVFSAAEDGRPFTIEGAKAFAAKRNEGLKVPTYKVFRLTEVTEES